MDKEFLVGFIIAFVEGLTEFLPVSSTGHMIIVGHCLGFIGSFAAFFEVFIQLGAVLSVFFLYPERFKTFFSCKGWNWRRGFSVWHIGVGCVPCMATAFFLYKYIKLYLFTPLTVAIGLSLGALLLWFAEWRTKGEKLTDDLDKMTLGQALQIGLFQMFSLWPGFSRSGSTIAGGMLAGLSRGVSASYTFMLAVPVMLGASLYDFWKHYQILSRTDWGLLVFGFLVAGIVAYFSMAWFVKFVEKHNLGLFAWYRLILALVIVGYFYS